MMPDICTPWPFRIAVPHALIIKTLCRDGSILVEDANVPLPVDGLVNIVRRCIKHPAGTSFHLDLHGDCHLLEQAAGDKRASICLCHFQEISPSVQINRFASGMVGKAVRTFRHCRTPCKSMLLVIKSEICQNFRQAALRILGRFCQGLVRRHGMARNLKIVYRSLAKFAVFQVCLANLHDAIRTQYFGNCIAPVNPRHFFSVYIEDCLRLSEHCRRLIPAA